ncbi:BREX-1 system adenine-specific DNA-methyltransferase PglX [Bifidobacterium pullorum subsp. saeculare]|uniref:BREX-1 system adenine-specific DNA-methyltransferase PglX n=1 Tax=Bifidobacterium pullorum TaxID=78448 RepID=UPI00195D34C0|nr:BREX-1 system adenine-specific DNA-methyltransferase PglX [Bifidobacterium pullorum subsp. saeculare]
MNISALQNFASDARRRLMGAVSAKLDAALAPGSSARVDVPVAVERLGQEIKEHGGGEQGKLHVVERYAYRWFNRIIAFRYMDVRGFTAVPVVSAVELTDVNGLPGVLAAAKRGEYDEDVFGGSSTMGNGKLRDTVEALFNGSLQSDDPQGQAYGLLLQAECRYWSQFMPFMFERVDSTQGKVDELLMPADLLAEGSVLRQAVATMTPDDCEDVEIIGWLYQFYIAERKTEVMNGFSKSKKAGADEIPAATQLFTPDWIVRYLVQNTVGRLWMQNHPDSQLYRNWEYYIQPEPEQNDQSEFLHIDGPEELTVCDPACGSGHMLTYAFELLYGIYEEQGYSPSEIPGLILANNLYGMEIDERAANLAAFALTMKARAKARRFFRKERQVQPHICLIRKEQFTTDEVQELNKLYGTSLDDEVWNTYANADVAGSLIQPPEQLGQLRELQWQNIPDDVTWNDFSLMSADILQQSNVVIAQTRFLLRKYAAVVANPPYMGSKNMGDTLKRFVSDCYPQGKADLMTAFMLRSQIITEKQGYWGLIDLPSWLTLSSFEELRVWLLDKQYLVSFLDLGRGIFGSDFGSVAFICQNAQVNGRRGYYRRLFDRHVEVRSIEKIRQLFLNSEYQQYRVDQHDFAQIPGSPIVYWLSETMLKTFTKGEALEKVAKPRQGLATADNNRFVHEWWEVSNNRTSFCCTSREEASQSGAKWFPYNKGGDFRKWYGNQEYVVNWEHDGRELNDYKPRSVIRNPQTYFRESISWSKISSGSPAFRYFPSGFIYDVAGTSIFASEEIRNGVLSFTNSAVAYEELTAIAPTLNFEVGQIATLPIVAELAQSADDNANNLICIARQDWDSYETSWDYQQSALLSQSHDGSLEQASALLSQQWQTLSEEQRQREIRNNELVADAYGVRDDVPCDVPLERVSLKRNSAFVYPDKTPAERDELFARDVVKEFISYAVGCMFGRYSIDKPGLILASQGETVDDFRERVPDTRFEPDRDNVIPVTEVDCFEDDIVSRFRRFLEVTFGSDHLAENLAYIERTLGKPLRKYFVNDFYNDHVAMYKNRPIYWQYSSRTDNKGAFKALVYMHRYTLATTHTVLEYLRDFTAKIADQANQLERSDRAKDKREAEKLHKAVTECKAYEDNVLYPLATRNLDIDLDDGVLVNYLRMGQALRAIAAIEKKRRDVATWTWPVHPLEEDWR